ncbi:MAG: hypothetical protein SF182_04755 [Deltaproteobacteria bacterium]|nr:hypothetical protein [Deltaproteobacteria bacterium]
MADASSPQSQDAALGAQLIHDDRWLNWNILRADHWAEGSAAELLDGRAWRRFGERLAALDERIRGVAVPDDALTRADGFRYVATLLRNALDVALEDVDPDRPTLRWMDRRNKFGWDCPDALYATIPLAAGATYWLRGRRGNVHFLGLQVAAGIRTLANAHADEWDIDADGRFEVVIGGPPRPRNWVPLDAGARWIFIRQFFYDWARERPSPLWIDRIDAGRRGTQNGRLDAAFFARRLDAVATNLEASVDLWLFTAVAQRERCLNAFPPTPFGGTEMGAMKHQAAYACYFRVAADQALLLEVPVPRARYWSVDLCNFWLESLDYANHQSSLNGHQAVIDADGVFRAVVTHDDPGLANWLDPVGHVDGSMIFRWNLAEETPVPRLRLLPRAELAAHLPADSRRVTPEERAAVIEDRRDGVRLRFARPDW